jgi:hypothetical protein
MNDFNRLTERVQASIASFDRASMDEARHRWQAAPADEQLLTAYACLLSKSPVTGERRAGARHLEALCRGGGSGVGDGGVVLFELIVALFSLGEYHAAREHVEAMRREQPDSAQVAMLHRAIAHAHQMQEEASRTRRTREAMATTAVGAVGAAILAFAFAAARKKE